MSYAERNRKLKSVLSAEFGRGKVRVTGDRGTAYGWVSVKIDVNPTSLEHQRELKARVWELINANGIEIGTYGYNDPGSDYGYGREIHIDFAEIKKPQPDLQVSGGGTVYLLHACTEAGKQWIAEHVVAEDYQRLGDAIAVEHRYIGDIVRGAQKDGMVVS